MHTTTDKYKLIPKKYINVFITIDSLIRNNKTTTVAIEGPSGSGKTSLATLLNSIYDCNTFHMDDFFLSADQKNEERLNEPGGNVDYIRFKNDVIDNLVLEKPFKYKPFSCKTGELLPYIYVSPKKLNIIEGVYSLHPSFNINYDFKIFLTIDEETQLKRILNRNGQHMLERFKHEWIPLENTYFNKLNIKSQCDLIINVT